jgi:hypothetical protein
VGGLQFELLLFLLLIYYTVVRVMADHNNNNSKNASIHNTMSSNQQQQSLLLQQATYVFYIVFAYYILKSAYTIRLVAIEEFGPVIHEFDPYFNFRATEVRCLVTRQLECCLFPGCRFLLILTMFPIFPYPCYCRLDAYTYYRNIL